MKGDVTVRYLKQYLYCGTNFTNCFAVLFRCVMLEARFIRKLLYEFICQLVFFLSWFIHYDFCPWTMFFHIIQNLTVQCFCFAWLSNSHRKRGIVVYPAYCHNIIHITLMSPKISHLCITTWIFLKSIFVFSNVSFIFYKSLDKFASIQKNKYFIFN